MGLLCCSLLLAASASQAFAIIGGTPDYASLSDIYWYVDYDDGNQEKLDTAGVSYTRTGYGPDLTFTGYANADGMGGRISGTNVSNDGQADINVGMWQVYTATDSTQTFSISLDGTVNH